jgi:hypothetical protein
MEGKELSTDDRLIIIRALEKAGDSVFNSNQGLIVNGEYGSWMDANKFVYKTTPQLLNVKPTVVANSAAVTTYSSDKTCKD